ncbi:hypothetical protein MPSI1_001873 [Malassezia psittaci]|uniref:Uncharacterized protein n=1 Tax=Malassezia psittaci TaxID=1821823 RepID=A0AAF0F9G7_9BASI|nr:hypothetical protein MPSI1_001873 [Malassezia psittaci]
MSEEAGTTERPRAHRSPKFNSEETNRESHSGQRSRTPQSPLNLRPEQIRSASMQPSRHSFALSDHSTGRGNRSSLLGKSKRHSHRHDDNEELDNFERHDDEWKYRDRGEALVRRRMRQRKKEKLLKLQREQGDMSKSFGYDSNDTTRQEPWSSSMRRESSMYEAMPSPKSGSNDRRLSQSQHERESNFSRHSQDYGDRDMDSNRGSQQHAADSDHNHSSQDSEDSESDQDSDEDLEYTLKDRQDALNFEHPFGLPIWKPALYKKSRSITRTADKALKCVPGEHQRKISLPGNLFWFLMFGVWIGTVCFVLSGLLRLIPRGGALYSRVLYGLATYIVWPFGNYVETECTHQSGQRHGPCHWAHIHEHDVSDDDDSDKTLNGFHEAHESTLLLPGVSSNSSSYNSTQCNDDDEDDDEDSPQTEEQRIKFERGVYHYVYDDQGRDVGVAARWCGIVIYAIIYVLFLAPLLGLTIAVCWFLVFPIPMARLCWVLLKNLAVQPLALHFRSPFQIDTTSMRVKGTSKDQQSDQPVPYTLRPGQAAPRLKPKHRKKGASKRRSIILLCNYRAVGREYLKYTVGGVNILFVNTLPIVMFTILDFFALRPLLKRMDSVPSLLQFLSGDAAIFVMSLCSVLPLSYFIGMAVASISAQSSIGMGAVINATFGSIIELILYSIALTEGRSGLVEGSLIGSILAGVLFMPGLSMLSGATRRKEQKFNAQSAGVTSTMLIMAIIGITTPTIFYQIYGTFELQCSGCPEGTDVSQESWKCAHCSYERVSPVTDPFYHSNVKGLVYICAAILILAYGIGLWFSLRTHATQIWSNAQNTPHAGNAMPEGMPPGLHRASTYKRMIPAHHLQQLLPTHTDHRGQVPPEAVHVAHEALQIASDQAETSSDTTQPSSTKNGKAKKQDSPQQDKQRDQRSESQQAPSSNAAPPSSQAEPSGEEQHGEQVQPHGPRSKMQHPEDLFLDAAAKMYKYVFNQQKVEPQSDQGGEGGQDEQDNSEEESGGHDAPSWSRLFALSVLLSCTVLYAIIAEILVDVVDVVVKGSGLPEKFIGVTIFALVPNTTEFMNAMSFAINGNIALSLEIGSAYVLQVCLIQIPVLVGVSALYNATHTFGLDESIDQHTFTLLFPRWDIIAILLSIFLLTYTYIEARSNYHRGSILVLAYIVFMAGFYFAPGQDPDNVPEMVGNPLISLLSH